MLQETVGEVQEVTSEEFVEVLETKHVAREEISRAIKTSMTELFGELSAVTILCYVGDAANGDLKGFARRTDELFGTGASMVLSRIIANSVTSGV